MRKYQEITKLVKKFSEEKVEHAIFGEWTKYTWLVVLIFLFVYDLSIVLFGRFGLQKWLFIVLIIFFIFVAYLNTRKVGIGITKNRMVYVRVSHLGYKEKKVFEIPYDKIRYIDVRKFFSLVFVKMTFISDLGRLEKIKFNFHTFMIGSEDFRKNSKAIYTKLVEVQKIVDKGDF